MSEPWLSDLSEDWKTPSSAASSSLPSQHQGNPSLSSRIPRPAGLGKATTLPNIKPSPQNSSVAKQRVLSERSKSDINVSSPVHPRSSPSPAVTRNKTSASGHASRPSTVSSNGSVIKRSSPLRKSSTILNADQRPESPVQEWKQHMREHNKGGLSRVDLFAPNPLEDLFQKPPSSDSDEQPQLQEFDSSLLPNLPSSPPPWPSLNQSTQSSLKLNSRSEYSMPLGVLHEQLNEDCEEEEELRQTNRTSPPPKQEIEDGLKEVQSSDPIDFNSDLPVSSGKAILDDGRSNKPKFYNSPKIAPSKGSSSTVSSGFSPVYISKHNTADGGVDYAAFDVSNPILREQLKESHSAQKSSQQGSQVDQTALYPPECHNSHLPALSQNNRPSLPSSTELVNVEKGARVDSFLSTARTLSPSASSTILPSDSASQIHGQSARTPSAAVSVETAVHWPNSQLESHDQDEANPGDPLNPQGHERSGSANENDGDILISSVTRELAPTNVHEDLDSSGISQQMKQEQHKRMQAIIGKRKDARYGELHETCDPQELARREILRPRNPAQIQNRLRSLSDAFPNTAFETNSAALEVVQKHIEHASVDCDSADEAELKALATEVATMRLLEADETDDEVRKPSVSTQDYLNDAMKIMELIRAKRQPQTDLSSLPESISEHPEPYQIDESADPLQSLTSQILSRPPNREGPVTGWRTQESQPFDAGVASRLEKYQETGDESFLATSAFDCNSEHSLGSPEYPTEHIPIDDQSIGIRIFDPPQYEETEQSGQDFNKFVERNDRVSSPVKTQSSNRSTNSSGRTIGTTSSQKTTTIGVIGPEKVSHLLHTDQGGMRFDAERKVWIRNKSVDIKIPTLGNEYGSDGTEDDPFGNIPDLSVDEAREAGKDPQLGKKSSNKIYEEHMLEPIQDEDEFDISEIPNSLPDDLFEEQSDHDHELPDEHFGSHSFPSDVILSPQDEKSKQMVLLESQQATLPRVRNVALLNGGGKRRDVSVSFSSPPVTKHYEAQRWSTSNEDPNERGYNEYLKNTHQENISLLNSSNVTVGSSPNSISTSSRLGLNEFEHEMSLSCIDEHHEVSFVGTRPDGRTMSLTLSISTPLPAHRHTTRPMIHSGNRRSSGLWKSLSPLSDFSCHQDDSKHMRARQLSLNDNQLILGNLGARPAVVINNLVQKLTDAEPDEPYWDFMRSLHLNGKDVSSLHTLDEFCPRIEELDVSENRLEHLHGAPINIRHLTARNNQLTSLSRWDHLINLQYLDISGNNIESLDGFSSLVHLREFKCDDNSISDLEGLFDLDGLLHVSLNRNLLQSLDFQSCNMKRLTSLEAVGNQIQQAAGLHYLPRLERIDLSQNSLAAFPEHAAYVSVHSSLISLRLANNRLESLDVKTFPKLQNIDADENMLTQIDNINELHNLATLSIRSQRWTPMHESRSIADQIDEFNEVRHLYLSGNFIPEFKPKTQFFNLQTLEVAFAGIRSMADDFGRLAPNMRTLNLNSNTLRDLRPLRGIQKLERLYVASNRLSRLRKTVKVISSLPSLYELDLRENSLTLGFYPSILSTIQKKPQEVIRFGELRDTDANAEVGEKELKHLLPCVSACHGDAQEEKLHLDRLDEDTMLRRRLYELLLAAKVKNLDLLDGRHFIMEEVFNMDASWERLVKLGVVEQVMDSAED